MPAIRDLDQPSEIQLPAIPNPTPRHPGQCHAGTMHSRCIGFATHNAVWQQFMDLLSVAQMRAQCGWQCYQEFLGPAVAFGQQREHGNAFQNAGSSVNGTSQRNKFTATANQTAFSGNDDDGVALAYDPNFLRAEQTLQKK